MEAAQLRDENPPPPANAEDDVILEFDVGQRMAHSESMSTAPAVLDPDDASLRPQVNEMLISSLQGDVLYEWNCNNPNARISFLEFVIQKSTLMAQGLPLGKFDRLEALGPESRVITHLQPGQAMFVVTSLVPAVQTASPASS